MNRDELTFFLRGRLNEALTRLVNLRSRALPVQPVPIEKTLVPGASPTALVPLLEGRSNVDREAAVARYLTARGIPFVRHRFATFEGQGENFAVDLGSGDRVLLLIAHHDAVTQSPGANDNAAAVAILLHLIEQLANDVPPGLRVRCLFTAAEERGYLGARAWVREFSLQAITGVLSLELCGIGDSLAIWDAEEETRFTTQVGRAFESLGLVQDETWHRVGRIPVFGSDHRAFAASGVPAHGLTVIPRAQADALRKFILQPGRAMLRMLTHRPVPFDTYHTPRDAGSTLDPTALDLTLGALRAVIAEVG